MYTFSRVKNASTSGLFQFALERRTRREAADSAAARQGEATQLSFLMRIGITHGKRMPHATRLLRLPADEKFHPIQIDFFSAQAIVQITNALANLVQKAD